jgi:hypothetical protein
LEVSDDTFIANPSAVCTHPGFLGAHIWEFCPVIFGYSLAIALALMVVKPLFYWAFCNSWPFWDLYFKVHFWGRILWKDF